MRKKRNTNRRTGSMTALLLVVMFAILAMSAIAINKSFMDVAASDLKSSLDLATKTGAVALGATQDPDVARSTAEAAFREAQPVGTDGSQSLELLSITFGNTIKRDDGSFQFVENQNPFNTIKVRGRYPGVFNGSTVPFNIFGLNDPVIEATSTAVRSDNDICLVVDRSGSMAWDLSNVAFQYPNGRSELANYFTPPDPEKSRWAALVRSVDRFQRLLKEKIPGEVRLGLASYSSDFSFGLFSSVQSEVDVPISRSLTDSVRGLEDIGSRPLIGDTNIAAGLQRAPECFQSADARRITGNKIVILFTDGLQSEGSSPVTAAANLKRQGFIVHVVSFSGQADQNRSRQIAASGGGIHFHADNEAELDDAFKNIAKSLPGTLLD